MTTELQIEKDLEGVNLEPSSQVPGLLVALAKLQEQSGHGVVAVLQARVGSRQHLTLPTSLLL